MDCQWSEVGCVNAALPLSVGASCFVIITITSSLQCIYVGTMFITRTLAVFTTNFTMFNALFGLVFNTLVL
jgi:hypothetical protein